MDCGIFVQCIAFLIAFTVFVEKLEFHKLTGFDSKIICAVQSKIDNPNTHLMKSFTFLGSPIVISVLVAVAIASVSFYRSGRRREAAGMLIANAAGNDHRERLTQIDFMLILWETIDSLLSTKNGVT